MVPERVTQSLTQHPERPDLDRSAIHQIGENETMSSETYADLHSAAETAISNAIDTIHGAESIAAKIKGDNEAEQEFREIHAALQEARSALESSWSAYRSEFNDLEHAQKQQENTEREMQELIETITATQTGWRDLNDLYRQIQPYC